MSDTRHCAQPDCYESCTVDPFDRAQTTALSKLGWRAKRSKAGQIYYICPKHSGQRDFRYSE